jgi:hypothetical protein
MLLIVLGVDMHQFLADSTLRIECGASSGSGFSFRHPSVAVTNYHVIKSHFVTSEPIYVLTEAGFRAQADLVSSSDEAKFDFALLKLREDLPEGRQVLNVRRDLTFSRGMATLFAGFPHGIHELLVHEASVSGPVSQLPHAFYIDGSVNGGNSGGPIVDKASGELIGLVTQRRFLGVIQLAHLRGQVSELYQASMAASASGGSINLHGIDFVDFAKMMARNFLIVDELLQENANTGIGIGFSIEPVDQAYRSLSLP